MNEINTTHGALNETASAVSSEKVIPGTTRDSGTNQIPTSLPQGYLAYGYNDEHGNQDIRYVLSYAQEIAAKLAPMEKELFRAFYRRISSESGLEATFQLQKRCVAQLMSRAYHQVSSGNAPAIFYEFFKANYEVIENKRDVRIFRDHMEAIYCFMK